MLSEKLGGVYDVGGCFDKVDVELLDVVFNVVTEEKVVFFVGVFVTFEVMVIKVVAVFVVDVVALAVVEEVEVAVKVFVVVVVVAVVVVVVVGDAVVGVKIFKKIHCMKS